MNEITQTNLNIIPAEDIEYLTKQSTAEIGKIVAGMTSLMHDTDTRVEKLESQGWFQRMCKTVTGSNKASREEIQKNNEKLSAYMAEAVSVLYDRQLIDEKMITNLGLQINMLYADHNQLKKQLGAFAEKLNKKIESVDNYHILFEEITLGHYSDIAPILAICEITSQLDERVMKDERRLKNLKEIIVSQEIINDEQRQITEYLNDMFALPAESIGQVAMEFSTLYEKSPIAQLLLGITENYHYLPETAKKMKKKSAIVEHVLNEYEIDDSATFSTRDIYEDFVNAKSELHSMIVPIEDNPERTDITEYTGKIEIADSQQHEIRQSYGQSQAEFLQSNMFDTQLHNKMKRIRYASQGKVKVVHYINQFYAGIGGEEKAYYAPELKKGEVIGPGMAFKAAFDDKAEIIATIVCGDFYFVEHKDEAKAQIVAWVKELQPDVFMAGPVFNAKYYGMAACAICEAVQAQLNIPVFTGMCAENPCADRYFDRIYILPTKNSVAGMKDAVEVMAPFAIKLGRGEHIGTRKEEGCFYDWF